MFTCIFSANCDMEKLFCLLSYGRQANCQIQSYAYPFDCFIRMDRTKPSIICSDLHQEPLISGIFTSIEGKHFAIGTILFPLTYLLGLHLIFKNNNRQNLNFLLALWHNLSPLNHSFSSGFDFSEYFHVVLPWLEWSSYYVYSCIYQP